YYQWEEGDGSSDENTSGGEENDEKYSIPSTPQNVTTKATGSSSIEVSWDAVDDADSYVVYYRQSLGVDNDTFQRNGTEITKITTNTSVSITGLEYKIYLFWVTAKNSAGESLDSIFGFDSPTSPAGSGGSSSESGNSGTTTTTLSAPTGLTATAASSSSIKLSWNSVSDAITYYVYKSEDSSSSTASVISSTTSTSTTATGLKANTKYYFWVKAVNDTTMSDYSSYAYATTKAASSSSGDSGSMATNNLLSDITIFNGFTAPIINITKTALTDGKNGFYISLSNSSEMNAEYYILYRSTTSKTDKSAYKKIKTVSRSSNIAFEDFDIDFTKNKTYYYVVVATSSKNDTYGTISTRGLSIVLGDVRLKYTISTDNSKQAIRRYVSIDGSDTVDTFTFAKGGNKYIYDSLEPGYHSIEYCKTLNGSYMQIVSNYNFLPGCEYSISLDSGNISSSSPTLSSKSLTGFIVP
ncbi:MAG: fibronectin type III domain-containing protein, partial [Treponemataceae bacterium]|nr:fibronectin type III domain-containing protein [Treponemataceae bacterium]